MIKFLFLDLDETILDFHKAERIALEKTFRNCGIEPTGEIVERYKQINIHHWKLLEQGLIDREQVKLGRFGELFRELGISLDPAPVSDDYEKNLSVGHYFLPGAREAVEQLSRKYRLFLASNGTALVQAGRLTSAKLYPFFEKCFVSEEVGFNKPSRHYFDACFAQIPDFDREKALMVGDSLSSDILGGINAGIRTCWVNRHDDPCPDDIRPDYTIKSLAELEGLLEQIDS